MNSASDNRYLVADLHVHSCLSPCAELTMVPSVVCEKGLDVLAITDHNSAGNVRAFAKRCYGTVVVPGVEVHTVEDVHILAYFPALGPLESFMEFVEANFDKMPYDPEKFGYEAVIDEDENFVEILQHFLGFPTNLTISQVIEATKKLGGLPVFAHVDRKFGAIHQLGLLPAGTNVVEARTKETYFELKKRGYVVITNSDAHTPDDVGIRKTYLLVEDGETEIAPANVLEKLSSGRVRNIWEI